MDEYEKAAAEIFDRYKTWLGGEAHGNQDEWSCVQTITLIIKKHCGGAPGWLSEALNSGDGVYRP